jgi:hypothetical protein
MVSKCANPNCSATFLYFHKGKLFRIESTGGNPPVENSYGKKPAPRLEFFWLCDKCAEKMTLAFEPGVGISVRAKFAHSAAAV